MHFKKRKKKINRLVNNEKVISSKNIGSSSLIRKRISNTLSKHRQDQTISDSLKIGSMNVNGLDLENCDEMEKIITENGLDVG